MTVERRKIRCFLADSLKGRTRAGENVRPQRFDPILPDVELDGDEVRAGLAVYTLSEQVTTDQDSPRTYARALEVAVEVFAQAGPEVDAEALEDLVDDVCDQVECVVDPLIPQLLAVRVEGAEALSVNPSRSGLQRVELGFDARGVQLSGAARLVYLVVYSTDVDEREQARATDLERARVTYRFPLLDLELPPAAEDDIDPAGG